MRFVRVFLGAALSLGCKRAPAPSPVAQVTSVSASASVAVAPRAEIGSLLEIPLGLPLSEVAGGPPTRRAGGSPALVIAVGADTVRVLAADGSYGWTRAAPPLATAKLTVPRASEGWNYPPEDKLFLDESAFATVPAGPAVLLGASRDRWAVAMQAVGVKGAAFLEQPLLAVRVGATTAYAAPAALEAVPSPLPAIDGRLRAPGFRGVVRAPFLAPFRAGMLAHAPKVGDETHVIVPEAPLRALPAVAHRWSEPYALAVDPAAKDDAIAALVVVADAGAIAFTLVPTGKVSSFVVTQNQIGSPFLARCEQVDLDGDGRAEWVLELVEVMSHGSWSQLVVLGGTSATGAFAGHTLHLGGDRGEKSEPSEYAWWIADQALFVARERDTGVVVERVRFAGGRLTTTAAKAEVLASFRDRAAAERAAIARGVFVFPERQKAGVGWAIGRAR